MSSLIVALDFSNAEHALNIARQIKAVCPQVKIGKELFTRTGPALVETLVQEGFAVFLDLKYHDIPNTVARACEAAADLGVWMVNVHALGGRQMLLAAREAVDKCRHRPLLIGVTILTHLDANDLYAVGLHGNLEENVLRLARLSQACGLDGLVCSPREVVAIRKEIGSYIKLITPGIRPAQSSKNDQKRTMTPFEALQQGANYLVIGRPITEHPNPLQALQAIEDSLIHNTTNGI